MRFLVDANLPRSTVARITACGHEAVDVRDIGLGDAPDAEIAAHAQAGRFAVVTRDYDFADIRNYPPEDYSGIVIIELPAESQVETVLDLVESFTRQPNVAAVLSGRLAIVEPGRVRFRPEPP